jgi:hypothetical protein
MSDYPAAHSMDTAWFAVDEHGHVARFESGEDGALPLDAATCTASGDGAFDPDAIEATRLAHLLANGKDPVATLGSRPTRREGRTMVVLDDASPALRSSYRSSHDPEAAVRDLLESGEFARVGRRPPLCVLSRGGLSLERIEELAARPGVRWILWAGDLCEALRDAEGNDGMFRFHHEHGADPGLYQCTNKPEQPLLIDDFPAPERDEIGALRLAVDFAAEDVHLADLLDPAAAATWGDLPLRYTEETEKQRQDAAHRASDELLRRRMMFGIVSLVAVVVVAILARHLG